MKYNNFKVMCVDAGGLTTLYTKGKIYEIKDGVFTYDDGDIEPLNDTFDDFINLRAGMFMRLPDYAIVNKHLSEYSIKEIAAELLRRYGDAE